MYVCMYVCIYIYTYISKTVDEIKNQTYRITLIHIY